MLLTLTLLNNQGNRLLTPEEIKKIDFDEKLDCIIVQMVDRSVYYCECIRVYT